MRKLCPWPVTIPKGFSNVSKMIWKLIATYWLNSPWNSILCKKRGNSLESLNYIMVPIVKLSITLYVSVDLFGVIYYIWNSIPNETKQKCIF